MASNSSACAVVNESGIGIAWAAGLLLGPRVRPEYVHPRNPPPDRQSTGIAVDHFANLPNSPDALQPRSVGQRDVGDAIVTHGSIRSTTIRLSSRGTGSGTSCEWAAGFAVLAAPFDVGELDAVALDQQSRATVGECVGDWR